MLLAPYAPALLESMRAVGYTLDSALADLVDNCISANARNIRLMFSPYGNPYVAVIDDGHGMSPDELTNAMRHGSQNPNVTRAAGDLGRFGLGLKTASLSQCSKLTVVSLKAGVLSARQWDLGVIADRGDWILMVPKGPDLEKIPHVKDLISQGHGTIVLWQNLDRLAAGESSIERVLGDSMNHVSDHLAMVFHRFVKGEPGTPKVKISVNENPLLELDPFLKSITATQGMSPEPIRVGGAIVLVQPYILPHISKLTQNELNAAGGEEGLRRKQGFYVYRGRRLIVWGTWFRLARHEELSKLARVQVDIPNSLDHLWTLDIKKSAASPPEIVRESLKKIISRIGERSKRVYQYRGRKVNHDNLVHLWDRIEGREGVCFRLNRKHPLYQAFEVGLDTPSAFGDYSYEVLDTKLARSSHGKFIIQLAFYSAMLADLQRHAPQFMYVVLGNGKEERFRVADYAHYFARIKTRFLARVAETAPAKTYPSPCEHCDRCHRRDLCNTRWVADDHLSLVANILKTHIRKLNDVGVHTLEALAALPTCSKVPKIPLPVLNRLRHQARLQLQGRQSGEPVVEVIVPDEADPPEVGLRGFARLPEPADGDLFFDMEGNPLEDGGLEYLFGVYYFEAGQPVFKTFWAHNRAEERLAFEAFMDFLSPYLAAHPQAHIYHYAAYELTALQTLMQRHGTREAEVDRVLRTRKLVDLYRVVREAVRVSEPRYSIKNIEHFYRPARAGNVQNAGASIVAYEKWKDTQDAQILQDIADYNRDDVESTFELRQWLLTLRPTDLPWADYARADTDDKLASDAALHERERRLSLYRERLLEGLPVDKENWGATEYRYQLISELLDFHRRAAKPQWWAIYFRQTKKADERHEDPDCIAGLTEPLHAPKPEARSLRYTFRYPEQELKLKTGDGCVHVDGLFQLNDLVVDEAARTVSFKLGAKRVLPAGPFDIGAGGPTNTDKLSSALYRYADAVMAPPRADGRSTYPAIDALLQRDLPRLHQHTQPAPLVSAEASVAEIASAVARLDESYLFIQGPPGAGKTFTGSRVIVALLKAGKRVGVSSNSHKAIINLLEAVEVCAIEEGFVFEGAKKSTKSDVSQHIDGKMIVDVWENEDLTSSNYRLIAGTAWLFADPDFDQTLDYLFVDEAGQVALGMLVPMATSARNVVLLGDQMQLSQPVQGTHPGDSGLSVLDYLLEGRATIAPERGIFLATTWRLHPQVCRFISEAVYDGRLHPEPGTAKRTLVLNANAAPELAPAGIRYLPMQHEGCSQWSWSTQCAG